MWAPAQLEKEPPLLLSFPNEFLMSREDRGIGGEEEKEKKFFLLSATVSNRSNYVIAGGGRTGETTCRAAQC